MTTLASGLSVSTDCSPLFVEQGSKSAIIPDVVEMQLHDVSADESPVRAVHAVKVVVVMNHILAERIQTVAVIDHVSVVDEVPLNRQSTVAV